jgi:hypothetical protein
LTPSGLITPHGCLLVIVGRADAWKAVMLDSARGFLYNASFSSIRLNFFHAELSGARPRMS